MRLAPPSFADPENVASLEWIEANGLGGYASQTVAGLHTRKYHGLLAAARRPPLDRAMLLATLVEKLTIDAREIQLSCHIYEHASQEEGRGLLTSFELDPYPVWTYEIDDLVIVKSLFMPQGENAVVLGYKLLKNPAKKNVSLTLVPLHALRSIHAVRRAEAGLDIAVQENADSVTVSAAGMNVTISSNAREVTAHPHWYDAFLYAEERARGYDSVEDLRATHAFSFTLGKKEPAFIAADADGKAWTKESILKAEKRRAKMATSNTRNAFHAQLERAADQFIARREEGISVIAGYHWFTDYGRDTMISIPGLLLARGRADDAKQVLHAFFAHLKDGLIPNRFAEETGEPEYNTADATLWMFQAIRAIVDETDDVRFLAGIFPHLLDIIHHHEEGTHFGISVDAEDGLLRQGANGFALTWMDAVCEGLVVTPRMGKAVEINALWYSALKCMEEWSALLEYEKHAADFRVMADRVRGSFRAAFWNGNAKCLYDCIDPAGKKVDDVRPNQVFAVSLRGDLLTREQQRGVLKIVEKELLTPVGLRSLAPGDPRYCKSYLGDQPARDRAYHQGTVWGWLIGPYVDAYLTVHGSTKDAKRDAKLLLNGLRRHLSEAGIGTLSEIFDGDAPHTPRGCIAQAWTVAEVLRVLAKL